jgi:hypothetical protein
MKTRLNDLMTAAAAAIAGALVSLQVLSAATPPDDFTTGAWPWKCNPVAPCPGVPCNQPNGFLCVVTLSQRDCTFNLFSTCSTTTPPADGPQNCGTLWRGNCNNLSCLYDPILDIAGTCARKWCS